MRREEESKLGNRWFEDKNLKFTRDHDVSDNQQGGLRLEIILV